MVQTDFSGKKILVLGLGLHGGGVGAARYVARKGALLRVTDLRSPAALRPSLKKLSKIKNIKFILGKHRAQDILWADLIIKNPGVPPDSPFLKLARKHKIPMTTDIGIFFRQCQAPIIGVTGTRGKSTTAYLIAEFLKKKFKRVFLAGNIRKSVLGLLDKIKPEDWVVLELSSFQLENLRPEHRSPLIAVFTNIFRDHLNWHPDMKAYKEAKSAIFKYQKKTDLLFIAPDRPEVLALAKNAPAKIIMPHLPKSLRQLVVSNLGEHYCSSVALAAAVALRHKVPQSAMVRVLKNFHGLPGRQEEVATVRGVKFINDTTATTPDAAMAALQRFGEKKSGKLILIGGGQDKKLLFGNFIRAMQKFADTIIFLPGTATEKIQPKMQNWKYRKKVFTAGSMSSAVKIAFRAARQGDVILLSPGAASFGLFLNEFDRGNQFINEVKKLKKRS